MIVRFKDQGTEDIFNGVTSKAARKACPQSLWRIASGKLELLDSVGHRNELKVPPGNQLEALSGRLLGLRDRLAARGMPESLIDRPAVGLNRVTERLNSWGLLV